MSVGAQVWSFFACGLLVGLGLKGFCRFGFRVWGFNVFVFVGLGVCGSWLLDLKLGVMCVFKMLGLLSKALFLFQD
jgi:hypothetical protein